MRPASLIKYVQSTFTLHESLVKAQLSYSTFDGLNTGRAAIFRAAKELGITCPDLLKCATPSLADVQHLQERCACYLQARDDAIALLHPMVFLQN